MDDDFTEEVGMLFSLSGDSERKKPVKKRSHLKNGSLEFEQHFEHFLEGPSKCMQQERWLVEYTATIVWAGTPSWIASSFAVLLASMLCRGFLEMV